jgi:hypothetical protein
VGEIRLKTTPDNIRIFLNRYHGFLNVLTLMLVHQIS